jgi:hypothetical protein
VIASRMIGPAGGVLTATTGSTVLRLSISPKALLHTIRFTLTRSRLSPSPKVIPRGTHVLTEFTLLTSTLGGKLIDGSFSQRSGVITVSNARITKRAQILAWHQSSHQFRKVSTTLSNGNGVVYFQRSGEFLIVVPAEPARGLTRSSA